MFRLIELTSKHRVDQDRELDRLKNAQRSAEKTLETREKAHRDRVRTLESQVSHLTNYSSVSKEWSS